MVEITMRGWGNSTIYRVILSFCFYCEEGVIKKNQLQVAITL